MWKFDKFSLMESLGLYNAVVALNENTMDSRWVTVITFWFCFGFALVFIGLARKDALNGTYPTTKPFYFRCDMKYAK